MQDLDGAEPLGVDIFSVVNDSGVGVWNDLPGRGGLWWLPPALLYFGGRWGHDLARG